MNDYLQEYCESIWDKELKDYYNNFNYINDIYE